MKSAAQHHTAILPLLIAVALTCLWLLPQMQAAPQVAPAPDGCYPNFTTAEGCKALNSLTTGAGNTAVGWYSLFGNSTGSFNTAVGAGALDLNTADNNTAVGAAALLLNTTGTLNTALGTDALVFNDTGFANTATGDEALFSNTTGQENTADGYQALHINTTGGFNTAIGLQALTNNTTGGSNIALGFLAGINVTTANGVLCIGAGGANVDNTTWIQGIYGVTTQSAVTLPVVVSNNHQLGTASSSRRFKKQIQPMDKASEAILGLKPVMFHYKSDNTGTPQFGLIAEEVADVNPDLVVRDENGEIYTVRYEAVNAMLLNEFLKEHLAFVEEQHKVAHQQEEIDLLKTELTEQRSLIQKVSESVELKSSPPQLVANKP